MTAASPAILASIGRELIWCPFRVARGCWAGGGLNEGGSWVCLGSIRLGKGLICRMRLGGFKVDFGSVLAWLGLICARCAAGLADAFGLLQGCGYASLGLGLVLQRPTTNPKPAQNLHNYTLKQPKSRLQPLHISPLPSLIEPQTNPTSALVKTSSSPTLPQTSPENPKLPPNQSQQAALVRCGRLAPATVNSLKSCPRCPDKIRKCWRCRGCGRPADQPTNQPTNQPPSRGKAPSRGY